MLAVISDVHANLPALEAVLADIDALGVEEVLCLGDVVGYGPYPVECLERVRARARLCLLGNHEEALLSEPLDFSSNAQRAVEWTREQLPREDPRWRELWEFMAEMPLLREIGPDMLVHGSPREPTQEYLLPSDAFSSSKYDEVFADFRRLLFVGHTHIPCVITSERRFLWPDEVKGEYRLDAGQAIINVGSVGQPRDGYPAACYVVVEEETVRWRRVRYDVERTMARILEVGLPEALAHRLRAGK